MYLNLNVIHSTATYLTPVCTTEFISFSKMSNEFLKRNCNLLALSIDSNSSHLDWVYNIYKNTGLQVPFPVIADRDMRVAKRFNMIAPNVSKTETIRSVYFIDPNQVIRAILTYPLTNGRNIGEILRLLDALQITDEQKVATPANWFPGQPVISPAPKDYNSLMERIKNQMDYTCYDWFLCYKQNNDMPLYNSYDKKFNIPTNLEKNMSLDINDLCN